MNILIVSQHYYPEQFRINDISFELAKRGHKVTVLTGLPNYPEGKIYDGYQNKQNRNQTVNGVHIIRTSLIGRGKSLLTFGLNYAWFAIAGKKKAKTLHENFDVIFSYQTSPVSMVWPAIEVKKRQNIPLVLYCLDQWPISITTGPFSKGTLTYSFFFDKSIREICIRNTTKNIVIRTRRSGFPIIPHLWQNCKELFLHLFVWLQYFRT